LIFFFFFFSFVAVNVGPGEICLTFFKKPRVTDPKKELEKLSEQLVNFFEILQQSVNKHKNVITRKHAALQKEYEKGLLKFQTQMEFVLSYREKHNLLDV
jgi:hypothetical protein